jgi:hypothetical protein
MVEKSNKFEQMQRDEEQAVDLLYRFFTNCVEVLLAHYGSHR